MTEYSKYLFSTWLQKPISRKAVLGAALVSAFASTSVGKSFGATTPKFTSILGRPTDISAALSLISSETIYAYIEYGYSKTSIDNKTEIVLIKANQPVEFDLSGLIPNSRIYYRVKYRSTSAKIFTAGGQGSFSTQKKLKFKFYFYRTGRYPPRTCWQNVQLRFI